MGQHKGQHTHGDVLSGAQHCAWALQSKCLSARHAVKGGPVGFRGTSLALNLPSEAAVDAFFNHAIACGASTIKQPEKVFWGGYSGYFGDPDGHAWEIAFNPFFSGDVATGQLMLEPITPQESEE